MCERYRNLLIPSSTDFVSGHRQLDGEGCPLSNTWTLNLNRAPVYFDKMTHDRKTQPQSAKLAGYCSILLPEMFKDIGQKVGINAFSSIGYLNLGMSSSLS